MKFLIYILLLSGISLSAQDNENISKLQHSFSITYETYMQYSIMDNDDYYVEDQIVNTSIIEDDTYIFGFGLRYAMSMGMTENTYYKLPLFGVGAEAFFDFMLDYQYTDFSREAFTYGVVPHIRFLYFFKLGYGFGYINFREINEFYGAESPGFTLHQGIKFYHFGLDVPLLGNFSANASLDIAENNSQFIEKWEILRFRMGITFR